MNTAIEFKNIKKYMGTKLFWKDSTFLLQRVNLLRSSVLPDAENNGFKNDKWPYRADKR